MSESRFKRLNTLLGWVVFGTSLVVYVLTVEPTLSFWDAGEYIATAAKLQVAHPPGAPLMQMIGSVFASFATTPDQIAKWVNYVSVVSSAFTVLFLFWTITQFLVRIFPKTDHGKERSRPAILFSGLVGSLAFTFSDSFWFNATETEVYSMASFVMALLLWLGLQWTDNVNRPRGNKWLLLIAFIVGLTFGIQFMGFLAIPSIVLLFYFKRTHTVHIKNFLFANLVAVLVLLLVFKFSLTYVLQLFGWGEVFFVNTFGLPFNSGSIIVGVGLALLFFIGLYGTRKKNHAALHTVLLAMLFLLLGFSSWLMLPIRASAQVVINENDPSDARSLLAYYNREQYPSTDSPFFGAYYTDMFAPAGEARDDRPKYERNETTGTYEIVNKPKDAWKGANMAHMGFLPRMWSSANAENYARYYGPLEFTVKPEFQGSRELLSAVAKLKKDYTENRIEVASYITELKRLNEYIAVQPPTLMQNVRYMLDYQFGYMYVRYFMWNFVGRQNDVQGRYNGNGNWISGIDFLDGLRLGNEGHFTEEERSNKGRNTYFFLPLLLGLLGVCFQIHLGLKDFWVLLVFFLFTGIAIQFYTNPPIFQPRERDYSLVGSFYVFAIWMGVGVYAFFVLLQRWFKKRPIVSRIGTAALVLIPVLMGYQNWDDHDRSNRDTALVMAKMYLDSTQEDAGAILFTIGDIDTFPLWYAQDIEGYRTDTRIICTTYFGTDWYIDQMKRRAYKSKPIPSQFEHAQYRYGTRDVLYYHPLTEKRWQIKDFLKWVGSDRPETKVRSILEKNGADLSQYSENYLDMTFYPTNKIRVPVNKANVLKSGLVTKEDANHIVDYIDIDLPTTAIGKSRLLMLDVLANNNWERPLYFSGGSFDEEEYLWMSDYLQLDGLIYKLVPIKTVHKDMFEKGRIDTELAFRIVSNWDWGATGNPNIYHDTQTRKQFGVSNRVVLARLLEELLKEEKWDKATHILRIAEKNIPVAFYGFHRLVIPFLEGYYKVGQPTQARKLYEKLRTVYRERLRCRSRLSLKAQQQHIEDILDNLQAYGNLIQVIDAHETAAYIETEVRQFNTYLKTFQALLATNESAL